MWRYLVESELRARWFAGGPLEERKGGAVELMFDHDNLSSDAVRYPEKYRAHKDARGEERIVLFEPPHRLAFSWDESKEGVVRFELFDEGGRTRLVLTRDGISRPPALANFGGGWHAHLAVLQAILAGGSIRNF